jgi:hypothetical protein
VNGRLATDAVRRRVSRPPWPVGAQAVFRESQCELVLNLRLDPVRSSGN